MILFAQKYIFERNMFFRVISLSETIILLNRMKNKKAETNTIFFFFCRNRIKNTFVLIIEEE